MDIDNLQATLDSHFQAIDKIILSRQDAITGLLPASTAVNAHGDYTDAWVRDNVYSISSVWGLSLAYKRYSPTHYRTFLLSGSVIKLMRGLLTSMMRQSDRVEAFKYSLNPIDALHAKYGTNTGLSVVGDDEWGHLQLDATSLYLLMLAQMTASGLQIIYTLDEVDFVQNLVHYISRSYCTPDYGIWERGNKINHGTTEINCSSVGMAKAALEAMDGLNLFSNEAGKKAVIHVIISDIARSRFTLQSLLPRESISKESDAALLSIIGYPAYAVEDEELVKRTRDKIIKKLGGRYGCKRFLLDGHQSSIEDSSRLHYTPEELREFEHIESQWPLFFTYLLLDALMKKDEKEIEHWQKKLQPLFVEQDGLKLLPELYIVPKEHIQAEKENPGSQQRVANENLPLVWAQSLYMLSQMILEGVLYPEDIDPLCRRSKCVSYRKNTDILVPIIAQNEFVKQRLFDLGFKSQTLDEVKPIKIMHAQELSKIHTLLGKNEKLGLTGRPMLVSRTITTSYIYLLDGKECIFLPYYFNPKGFYFSYDNKLLVEHFRTSLKFLALNWDKPGEPIMPFLVREDMFFGKDLDGVLALLYELQNGICDFMVIKTGPLSWLLATATREHIDNLPSFSLKDLEFFSRVKDQENISLKHDMLGIEAIRELSFDDAEALYFRATISHNWALVRRLAEITNKFDDRLEDVLLDIITRQKRLAVGRAYFEKAIFFKPCDNSVIIKTIDEFCGNNVAEGVLIQEIILHIGYLIRTEPKLFENMLTLRVWYFVQLLVGQITREQGLPIGEAYEALLELAPYTIYDRLRTILKSFTIETKELIVQENLHALDTQGLDKIEAKPFVKELPKVDDWADYREQIGMIGRLSAKFYENIWHLLQQCNALVVGDKYSSKSRIGAELTLESTAGEQSFALKIDALLQSIDAPEYRQLNIEVMESLVRLFKDNPKLRLKDDLILDVLIGHAVRVLWQKHHGEENYDEHRGDAWRAFYKASPKEADRAFIEAFIYLLKQKKEE